MTIFQLRYFVALAELKNFSKVAERFFVAQSAVSYHIHTLETELGVQLFTRTTRSVRLTSAGLSFSREIRPLLAKLDEAVEHVKKSPQRERFTLAYSRLCYGTLFNRMLEQLSQLEPNVDIVMESREPEDGVMDLLADSQIDAALFFNLSLKIDDRVKSRVYPAYGGSRTLIVSDNHRYSKLKSIDAEEIDPKELLACGPMRINESRLSLESGFDSSDILLRDFESLFAMIKAGRGVAAVPIIDDINVPGLSYIPVKEQEHPVPNVALTLAWNREIETPFMSSLLSVADGYFKKHP